MMNYSQSLRYLNSFLNLERILFTPRNRLWNLGRMRQLLEWFGHPEKKLFPILIAGTKGKGSTGFFLESILDSAGVRAGFYSSPHLEDPRERIRIQRKMVSKKMWCKGIETIRRGLIKHQVSPCHPERSEGSPRSSAEQSFRIGKKRLRMTPRFEKEWMRGVTYFEILTLLAVLLFKEAGVEAGVFEVGLGGRLDATNALGAKVVILTPVHMDHEAILGNTIAKITAEKAAVVHQSADVIVSPQLPEALRVIQIRIRKQKARSYPVRGAWPGKVGLRGDFQKINAGAAALAAKALRSRGFQIPEQAIRQGLQASDWPGRMETFPAALGPRRDLLIDGAHNPAAIRALVRNLRVRVRGKARLLIFGTSRDKNSAEMLKILGSFFANIILCRNPNPRSQEIGTLISHARPWFQGIFPAANVPEALELAKSLSKAGDTVVATGSFYLIGEIRKKIKHA